MYRTARPGILIDPFVKIVEKSWMRRVSEVDPAPLGPETGLETGPLRTVSRFVRLVRICGRVEPIDVVDDVEVLIEGV